MMRITKWDDSLIKLPPRRSTPKKLLQTYEECPGMANLIVNEAKSEVLAMGEELQVSVGISVVRNSSESNRVVEGSMIPGWDMWELSGPLT